jgi:hypothetical protein
MARALERFPPRTQRQLESIPQWQISSALVSFFLLFAVSSDRVRLETGIIAAGSSVPS